MEKTVIEKVKNTCMVLKMTVITTIKAGNGKRLNDLSKLIALT